MLYFYYILLYFIHYSLQNYMYGHIYQDFIITTHYYIVFYHFNNSYLQLSHVVDLRHVKRSLNLRASRNLGKITGKISRLQFHLSVLGSLASLRTYRQLPAKVGTSKGGGKQWQTTSKNLSRMPCARAIPVTWLGSGSCQPGL
jgi:hypothetical protein